MQNKPRFQFPTGVMLALVTLAGVLLWNRPVESQSPAAASPRWEYKTDTADANFLSVKLDELAKENWEVFSIVRADSVVEQDVQGKAHVVAVKYQLTARRQTKR